MIPFDTLIITVDGLHRDDVVHWVALEWLRPDTSDGVWMFADIDVARLRLILDLRQHFALDDVAMPVVLHLLDQLYDARRRLRRLGDAVDGADVQIRDAVLRRLAGSEGAALP